MTLAEHLMMAASAMFYIAINCGNELNMKLAASNVNIKIVHSWCPRHHCTAENLKRLETNWLLNNV